SWRRAIHIGIPKDKLKKIVKSTVLFTIIPSLAIVIALFSLASLLGVPLSLFRLSVVGSLSYELFAAEMTVCGFGYVLCSHFVVIFLMIFLEKRLQTGLLNYQEKNSEWGTLAMSYFMLSIAIVFLPLQAFEGLASLLTLLTSALVCYIHFIIIDKFKVKWLGDFVLANSLIIAMISSVFWDKLFG